MAYNTTTNCLHELNPVAALLVELCNGQRTAEEVVALAESHLPPDSDEAALGWLKQAVESQVLMESSDSAAVEIQELTAEGLVDLANQLRDAGSIQAAFLCQQRATELEPRFAGWLRHLGELAHILGKRLEARQAYEAYLELQPDDSEIRHLLTSLRDARPPARVPDDCIQQLYQRFSEFYENNMCDELSYEGPTHLGRVIDQVMGDRTELSVLDLGCGTGLAGAVVSERASRLVGVDLSVEMIERARERKLYDELHVAEVTSWLTQSPGQFDLILACDTLIYFGDLAQVIVPATDLLKPGGVIAFSVELAETGTFRLTDNGRYVHHPDHIHLTAESAGMKVAQSSQAFLRMEYGNPVTGLFVALKRS